MQKIGLCVTANFSAISGAGEKSPRKGSGRQGPRAPPRWMVCEVHLWSQLKERGWNRQAPVGGVRAEKGLCCVSGSKNRPKPYVCQVNLKLCSLFERPAKCNRRSRGRQSFE